MTIRADRDRDARGRDSSAVVDVPAAKAASTISVPRDASTDGRRLPGRRRTPALDRPVRLVARDDPVAAAMSRSRISGGSSTSMLEPAARRWPGTSSGQLITIRRSEPAVGSGPSSRSAVDDRRVARRRRPEALDPLLGHAHDDRHPRAVALVRRARLGPVGGQVEVRRTLEAAQRGRRDDPRHPVGSDLPLDRGHDVPDAALEDEPERSEVAGDRHALAPCTRRAAVGPPTPPRQASRGGGRARSPGTSRSRRGGTVPRGGRRASGARSAGRRAP